MTEPDLMSDSRNRLANQAIVEAELGGQGSELRWRRFRTGDLLVIDPGSPPRFRVAFGSCMLDDYLGGARFCEALRSREFRDRFAASQWLVLVVERDYTVGRLRLVAEVRPDLPEWAR